MRERESNQLALRGVLLFLFVTNSVTLYALTGLNVRYAGLQAECSAELRERDILFHAASKEANKAATAIEACQNATRRAAVVGSVWLTVAVEASQYQNAKSQVRSVLGSLVLEAPMRSLPGTELRLYNMPSSGDDGSNQDIEGLEQVTGLPAWREYGRLSTFPRNHDVESQLESLSPSPPESSIPGATPPGEEEQKRSLRFASMLRQLDGSCQHALFMELSSGAQLCPAALHKMRSSIARADSFWGTWSAIRFSHGVDGIVMPCTHLAALAGFISRSRTMAALPQLFEVWLARDAAKFSVLHPFRHLLPSGSGVPGCVRV